MLERILTALAGCGFHRTIVVVGHLGDLVRGAVGETHDGMAVDYATQPSPNGTADAAARALAHLQDDAALLTWTDILVPPAHYALLATSWTLREVVALTTVVAANPSVGALVEFDKSMLMTAFTEKPLGVTRGWADGGVGIFDRSMFERMRDVEPSARGEKEIASALKAAILDGDKIGVERLAGPWIDLGSPEAVSRCETDFPELLAATGG